MSDLCLPYKTRCEDPLLKRALTSKKQFKTRTRDEVRDKIGTYTFIEARRVKGPIYDALVQELYEANCPITAGHVKILAAKEDELIANTTIRDRMSDPQKLQRLLELVESAKTAEMSMHLKQCGGHIATFRMLYQILLLLEPVKVEFYWLVRDVYPIIGSICDWYMAQGDHQASEMLARIYDLFGDHLVETGGDVQRTVEVYEKALFLARGESWLASPKKTDSNLSLHKTIGSKLADCLIRHAEKVHKNEPKLAAELIQRAKAYCMETSKEDNTNLFYGASIAHGKYIMMSGDLMQALKIFQDIQSDLTTHKTIEKCALASELYYNMGVCLLDLKETAKATEHLRRALALSRIYKVKPVEAQSQLKLGQIYSATGNAINAVKAYNAAMQLFKEMKDQRSKKKVACLLANLKANEIFPGFLEMIKSSSSNCCAMYNLRRWKLQCQPFWDDLPKDMRRHQIDPLLCLLEKDTEDLDEKCSC